MDWINIIEGTIESIIALKVLLVDYGEAPIKTEVEEWHHKHNNEMKDADSFQVHNFYRNWFEFMIETQNKYGMLFESQPKGYSNVEMKSV